jgi:hypothetical protein
LHPISNRLGYFQSWKPCIERSKVQLQHKWIHRTATKKTTQKFKNSRIHIDDYKVPTKFQNPLDAQDQQLFD